MFDNVDDEAERVIIRDFRFTNHGENLRFKTTMSLSKQICTDGHDYLVSLAIHL